MLRGISDDEHLVSNVSKDGMASHTTYLHLSLHDDCSAVTHTPGEAPSWATQVE